MFRRNRPSRSALYERLLAEKDVQIARLLAQLEGRPLSSVISRPAAVIDGKPAVLGSATWDSDLDEAQAILDKNGLSKVHLPEILDALGVGSSDLS
jgi:hypothetical protein